MKKMFILNTFLCHLLICSIAAPHPQYHGQPQSTTAFERSQAEAITAQSVNSDLAFVQNFMQFVSQLFNNFNTLFPKFISLFTTTAPAALALPNLRPAGQALPSLPEISGAMPSIPNFGAWQPEKINNARTMPRDVELIENDAIEAS